ncbi:MAG: ThuA domain-containing protein [Firmicutes bacterium]|nr:ThuA domain-containing protein [Bacillota bacterium]
MSQKPKGILFGDYNSDPHPVNDIDKEIIKILQDDIDVSLTEDYGSLTRDDLVGHDLVISYANCWKEKTSPKLVHAMLSYVSGGGALLAIHNGIHMSVDFELAQMLGGRFVRHPEYQTLGYTFADPEHPIVRGMDTWSMGEEPYQFAFDDFCEKNVFLEYTYEGGKWPAGWTIEYGLGRIAYLAPGHDVNSFMNLAFRELILRSSRWARGII